MSQTCRVGLRSDPMRNGMVLSVRFVLRSCQAGLEHGAAPLMGATQLLNHELKFWLLTEGSPMRFTLPGRSNGVPDWIVPMKLYSQPEISRFTGRLTSFANTLPRP